VLSYAVQGLNPSKTTIRKLNVCWNSVYRKIFSYKPWESVSEVMIIGGRRRFGMGENHRGPGGRESPSGVHGRSPQKLKNY